MTGREALRYLRAHRQGVLIAGEVARRMRFCACPREGFLAMYVDDYALESDEHLLFTPDEQPESMQVLLAVREEEPAEELRDRWAMLHADPPRGSPRFVGFDVDTARIGREVFDGPELMIGNALAGDEGALVARANADSERLTRACAAATGVLPTEAVCATVDEDGMSVRHKLGVLRVAFEPVAGGVEDAAARIDEILRGGDEG